MKDKSFKRRFVAFFIGTMKILLRKTSPNTARKEAFAGAKAMVVKMAKYRQDRINEEMFREAAQIIREVKDPRVSNAFVSVTGVEVTPDLKYAKIYYSALRGDKKEVTKGLAAATGYVRTQLARRRNLRITPELTFAEDTSIAYGAKIEKIISGLTYAPETPEETESESVEDNGGDENA